jgi:hypothetical protein
MNRRDFLKGTAAAGAAAVLPLSILPEAKQEFKKFGYPFPKDYFGYPFPQDYRKKLRREALEKWSKEFDFSVVEEEYAPELAIIIDNQHLMNEIQAEGCPPVDLEFVYNLYSGFIGRHLVSVQSMVSPTDMAIYEKFEWGHWGRSKDGDPAVLSTRSPLPGIKLALVEKEVTAKTRTLKTPYHPQDAHCFGDEITREIITDLRTNPGTTLHGTITTYRKQRSKYCLNGGDGSKPSLASWAIEELYCRIVEITGIIHRNWIVTSPEIAQIMKPDMLNWTSSDGIHKAGTLCGAWDIYVDPLYPKNELLIGRRPKEIDRKDWNYDTGYIYCPYIPATRKRWTNTVATRYAKLMPSAGVAYYGKLVIDV